jgi:hypothetical protein
MIDWSKDGEEGFDERVVRAAMPGAYVSGSGYICERESTGKRVYLADTWSQARQHDTVQAWEEAAATQNAENEPAVAEGERERFENWLRAVGAEVPSHSSVNGEYTSPNIELVWRAWQARAALSSGPVEGMPPLPERWERNEYESAGYMGLAPNGEFVRWHRYMETRNAAESIIRQKSAELRKAKQSYDELREDSSKTVLEAISSLGETLAELRKANARIAALEVRNG